VAGYVFWENSKARKTIYSQIDRSLFLAASSLRFMLTPDFHDRAIDEKSISYEEEIDNRKAFNSYSKETDFAWLYTLVEKDGKYYFAAPTVSDKEAKEKKRWYFLPYPDIPDEFVDAFTRNIVTYASYSDQWGDFRSIAIPQISAGGRRFLACADVETSYVKQQLRRELMGSMLHVVYFIALTLPFLLFFFYHNNELYRKNIALQDQSHSLAVLAEERLKTHEELEKARDEAEQANREKSNFLANMSHEIRTPINIITGMTHLTLGTELLPNQKEYVKNIRDSANLLINIVNDILDFSKAEAGQLNLEMETFSVVDIVNEVHRLHKVMVQTKGIDFILDMQIDPEDAVNGDPSRLQQILMNLVGNAIKFTENGNVVLGVQKEEETRDMVVMKFSIKDTGIGIEENDQERLFKPFSQIDSSLTRKYGGTGLGLVISKKLAELMHGNITCESESGKGSLFTVTIPFCRARKETAEEPGPTPLIFAPEKLFGKKILVVDDHALNRDLLRVLLGQAGFQVSLAENGLGAIESAMNESFDLILMDIQMPEMDGLAATREIRKAGNTVPIVAMTSHARKADAETSLAAGMNDHLTKPIDLRTLHAMIVKWIPDLVLQ
jgi:signal transduction histidine kinase